MPAVQLHVVNDMHKPQVMSTTFLRAMRYNDLHVATGYGTDDQSLNCRSVDPGGALSSMGIRRTRFWYLVTALANTPRSSLAARGNHRVLRVARTLADLDGADTIGRPHLAEALPLQSHAAPWPHQNLRSSTLPSSESRPPIRRNPTFDLARKLTSAPRILAKSIAEIAEINSLLQAVFRVSDSTRSRSG
jgi:hypothetical protein